MRLRSLAATLLVAVPVSTIVAACDRNEDTGRDALEQDALERDLDRELELALQADTAVQHELGDVPEAEPPVASAPPTPAPEPAPPARPAPRRAP
ncbi:MAG TPA: hypothetical protein VGR37_16570, partial [Longimicrobiaceae bacterium]|nr:hypothetical protein [Longimicrobiaceae bacterium]